MNEKISNKNKILVMIKPWCVNYKDDILSEFDKIGDRIKEKTIGSVSLENITNHYYSDSVKSRSNYTEMIIDYVGEKVVLAIYEGSMNEFNNLKEDIRKKYASKINFNPNHVRNAVHVSDSSKAYLKESEAWDL
ncbi:hypothetical protein K9L67_05505 [Candidatus Woesearchaeota archaeon]|nr:hypothetical protein [Candidatus Woesearchaeota archaeon]MCF7901655.1 hypothetical protein [Candidatus Woesearchaeota archaeon]MCF8013860.1 hypothetical protein [Candidatus Woesearchaeota archaeon]